MAAISKAVSSFSSSLMFIRLLNPKLFVQTSVRFGSTLREPLKERPVQYSTSKASKVSIAELLGYPSSKKDKNQTGWFRYTVVGLFALNFLYFGALRQESEVDEILKGNIAGYSKTTQLLDLKLKYNYCIKNKLPADNLRAKIREIEDTIPVKKVFRM